MKADVGWFAGHIRISNRDDFRHGDHDWDRVLTLTVAIDGAAELSGLEAEKKGEKNPKRRLTLQQHTAIGKLLWSLGFKEVRWARHLEDNSVVIKQFSLERFK